ncbi:MAG: energy-coupling factor ABC transporter ATP-binding protein [Clostridiales bacterium]|nr:energy-coupling factor ABC transporter ATP-binding protein [Clostridiales bacterium]
MKDMVVVKGLSFQYANGARQVLKQLNLTVPEGGFLGIIGPSGAGKTTLIQAMNGMIPHHFPGDYYGSVTVDGRDAFDSSVAEISRSAGTVFQDIDSQMVAIVVEDEILYGLENFGVPKKEIEGRITESLELVGISDLRYRSIRSLSGGQKQKVAIAAILALKPKLLLLDEPTGELDPASSRQIFSILRELNETQNITVIVVEQKIMLLCEFAKELGVLSDGELLFHGPVREVLSHSAELEEIGVQCPRVATLSAAMAAAGIGDGRMSLNLDEAEEMVRRCLA